MKVEPRSPHFQDLPDAIKRALAIEPDRRSGTIRDVDHVVILMQENRSFDHYFGTLPGARLRRSASRAHARRRRADAGRRRHPHRSLCLAARASQRHAGGLHHAARGTTPSAPGTTAAWTSGCPPRAVSAWAPTAPPSCRSRPRWPTPSRCARPITARCRPAPIPTGCSCGPAPTIRAARPAARPWSTPMTASAPPPRAMPGPPIPNGCSRPAWTGVSTRTWPITSTTIPWPAFANTARRMPRR